MVYDSSEDEYEPSQQPDAPPGLPIKRKHLLQGENDGFKSNNPSGTPIPRPSATQANHKNQRLYVDRGMLDDATDSQTWVEQYAPATSPIEKPWMHAKTADGVKREPSSSPGPELASNPTSTPRRNRAISPPDFPESQLPETWSNCSDTSPIQSPQKNHLTKSEKFQQELVECADQHFEEVQQLQNRIEDKTQAMYASEAWAQTQETKWKAAEWKTQELVETMANLESELNDWKVLGSVISTFKSTKPVCTKQGFVQGPFPKLISIDFNGCTTVGDIKRILYRRRLIPDPSLPPNRQSFIAYYLPTSLSPLEDSSVLQELGFGHLLLGGARDGTSNPAASSIQEPTFRTPSSTAAPTSKFPTSNPEVWVTKYTKKDGLLFSCQTPNAAGVLDSVLRDPLNVPESQAMLLEELRQGLLEEEMLLDDATFDSEGLFEEEMPLDDAMFDFENSDEEVQTSDTEETESLPGSDDDTSDDCLQSESDDEGAGIESDKDTFGHNTGPGADHVSTDPSSEWYPWSSREQCILDILRHLPRSSFSRKQNETIQWAIPRLAKHMWYQEL
ncbi:hypothetical protein K435DRAFT_791970 [Dendrothele bispora CBS 962.96]|uniref:Uncharacterized protein n=1 Tax=Dendrothele bispora (strain CBS 962.96) TaxID=1314807 RepID=A0A4S8MKF5_DENBC|nr:hypothetical protein K435DRAFT_791970 [Dendrothele bispora CBS 962.96]